MREEIALWYFGFSSWDGVDPRLKAFCYKRADELLGIMRSKIEALENPYVGAAKASVHSGFHRDGFEDCRREVVALFGDGE